MNLKKLKIINIISLFALSFLWHFIYKWFPNTITSIFFPVNESIWEHMKIIFNSFVIISLLSIYICKKKNIIISNKYFEIFVKSLLGIIFYLIIFIPVYKLIGESMIFSIGLMLLTYILMETLGYKILNYKELNLGIPSIIAIIIMYIVFGILTYKPMHNFVFYDESYQEYGILSKNK